MTQPEALRLADWLQAAVQTYPQTSEDEPGGYASEVDQVMDEAAAELRRLHAENEALRADADRYRWLRDEGFAFADVDLGIDQDGDSLVSYRIRFHLPEPANSKFDDDEWTGHDIDAAIDAARKGGK